MTTPRRGRPADDVTSTDATPTSARRAALDASPAGVPAAEHGRGLRRIAAPLAVTTALAALVSTVYLAPSNAEPDVSGVAMISTDAGNVRIDSRTSDSAARSADRVALTALARFQETATLRHVAAVQSSQSAVDAAQQTVLTIQTKSVAAEAQAAGVVTQRALTTAQDDLRKAAEAKKKAAEAKRKAELAKVISMAACASGSEVESGLQGNGIKIHRSVCAHFPTVTAFGGRRAEAGSEHNDGHALDCMIPNAQVGRALADWARANADKLGVTQVIYAQHIWTTKRNSEGWRQMGDRGSVTANHFDHVHISFS